MLGTTTTGTTTTTTTDMLLLNNNNQTTNTANTTEIMAQLPFHHSSSSSSTSSSESIPSYNPLNCLFCNSSPQFSTPSETTQHMQTAHGLFIPHRENLAVELDTLLSYLHLIIFGYKECLYCHTTRRTVQAVQQHMMGKGHCRFDLHLDVVDDDEKEGDDGAGKGSEFRDFYDFSEDEEEDGKSDEEAEEGGEENEEERRVQLWSRDFSATTRKPTKVDDTSMRLPSGKILSSRSTSTPAPPRRRRHHPSRRPLQPPPPKSSMSPPPPPPPPPPHNDLEISSSYSPPNPNPTPELLLDHPNPNPTKPSSKALQKEHRRRQTSSSSTLAIRISNLRSHDRRALSHLSDSEKFSVMTLALRQKENSDRTERRFRARMDGIGNLKSKERFVNDVPGGKSHKNRFMAQ